MVANPEFRALLDQAIPHLGFEIDISTRSPGVALGVISATKTDILIVDTDTHGLDVPAGIDKDALFLLEWAKKERPQTLRVRISSYLQGIDPKEKALEPRDGQINLLKPFNFMALRKVLEDAALRSQG